MENRFCWLYFALAFASTGDVVSGCNMNTLSNMATCMSTAMPINMTSSSFDLGAILTPLCNENVLQKIIDCVQPVIDACKNATESISEHLASNVDLQRMKDGWTYICDNLDELSAQAGCISGKYQAIGQCVQAKMEKISAEQNAQSNSQEASKEFSCKLMIATVDCMSDLTADCGNVKEILKNYFKATQPPLCDKYKSSTSRLDLATFLLAGSLLLSLGRKLF